MLFYSAKFLTLALTVIGCATASPVELHDRAQNVIIGYRTVSEAQAKKYNAAGTLTNDANVIGTQIGKGVYTTPGAGDWAGSSSSWYCVILADSAALSRVTKAWIPKTSGGKTIWFKGDTVVDNYIKSLDKSWNPAKTMRMSIIDGSSDLQMVIPPGLLNSNKGGLGITASCKKTVAELPSQRVNFADWAATTKGSRT